MKLTLDKKLSTMFLSGINTEIHSVVGTSLLFSSFTCSSASIR